MRLIIFIGAIWLATMNLASAQPAYCRLKGPVFVESDPAKVQFRVFIEESDAFADLLVFKTANALFADEPGLWFFTKNRAQADFSIQFVAERSLADFSIHYIETESFAGCQTSR